MADIKESPPLFDTNEAKVDDLDDDDEDIFASAVQVPLLYIVINIRVKKSHNQSPFCDVLWFYREYTFIFSTLGKQCIYKENYIPLCLKVLFQNKI